MKTRRKKLEANIWKFYLYRIFASIFFAMPIFVLYYQDNGLSMTQVMILQSIYTAISMVTVILFGIIADYIGRKKVLVASTIIYILTWVLFAMSHNFKQFLLAEIAAALSASMWVASGTAFFYDNLRELKREKKFKKLYGNVISINYLMWGISALIGGYMAVKSLRFPYWATTITAFIALLVSFTLTETKKYKHADTHYLTHLKQAAQFAIKHPKVRLFILYSSIIFSMGFICYMFYQPYFNQIKINLVYFGWIYLLMNLAAAFGSKSAHKIEKYLGEKKILLIILLIMIISFFGISKELIILGAIFPILLSFNSGIFEPVISDYMNKHIDSHHRSTVLSLGFVVTQMMSTVLAPFFGWIVDFWSLETAFLTATIILIINLVILIGLFIISKKK
ncbi:hypothetical protein CEE44_04505 [Candidatus Woesearchaeota archaeon B3_Woes]|nr:MAG: hypothetical protein CEE44_04505 [Candidatus Woesearchaeota archaeon B3_Woes]